MAKVQAYCLSEKRNHCRRAFILRAVAFLLCALAGENPLLWAAAILPYTHQQNPGAQYHATCVTRHVEACLASLRFRVPQEQIGWSKVSHRTILVTTKAPTKPALEAIPRNRVFTKVAEQLQAHIGKELKPGDMLPPERELVEMFGVSRSSIRDAIRRLETVGLLEPRQGVGTVVRELSADAVVAPVSGVLPLKRKVINELLDVRMIIEPAVASRAALHASRGQIAEMARILDRQDEKVHRGELATEEDTNFHYAIALAADNSVMLKLIHVLMDSLREMRERSLQAGGRQAKSLAAHRRILAAIQQGDAAAAEAAMRRHLWEVQKLILQKLEEWRLSHGPVICG